MFAGSAQAAPGLGFIIFPLTFVASAYVPVESMPFWLQVFAENQPISYMVDAVRALTQGSEIESLRGHPAGYFVTRSLLWSAIIVALFAPLAVAEYRRG